MLERIVSAVTYGMNPKRCFQEVQLRNCWRRDGAMSRPASSASERSSIVGSSLTTRSRQRTGLQIYLSLAVLDTREVKGRRKRSLLLFTLCPHSALARYSPYHGACRTVCKAYSQVVIGDGLSVVHSLSLLFSHTILPKSARLSADMSSREKKPCHEGTAQQRVHALSLAAQVTSLNTCT